MEMLQVADAVAREKGIDREIVLGAMEEAIQKAGRSKYGMDHDIRVIIDRTSGAIEMFRYRQAVAEIEDPELESQQLLIAEAKKLDPAVEVGGFIIDPLPPLDFGRIAAQTAKQVILQKVREAERARMFLEYKDRAGEIVSGVVKRVEYGNVTIDLGRAEAYMRRDETLPREHFKNGDRVRAYIFDVREEQRGPQIFISRTHPEFMAGLFKQEVPEIYDNIIEIKAVARDPGSRAKIAVTSRDSSIDPVGACVGMRGSRVQAVVNELQGEKIDIIEWTDDTAAFVVKGLSPATVEKVIMDDHKHRIEVVVPEEQLSLAIGRRGQNVRLASILSGWDIDIMTEEEEAKRRNEEVTERSALFMSALDVDEVIAHLLVVEGFVTIEDIVDTPSEEVARIEGFDEDVSAELKERARVWLEAIDKENDKKLKSLKLDKSLLEIEGLTSEMLIKLGENDVRTADDVGDLATDELIEILGEDSVNRSDAEALIMAIRETWFEDEVPAEDTETAEGVEGATEEAKEASASGETAEVSDAKVAVEG